MAAGRFEHWDPHWMNYCHAFHAGNFADCFKHALLVALVDALTRKTTPIFVLDTHAGAGWYDLKGEPARRTREADRGIHRLVESRSPVLHRYLRLVESIGLYPGSPLVIRTLLRVGDRLGCCELDPEATVSLRRQFQQDPQVAVHDRSGWEALGSLLPPKEKRGLVFIDPPFENKDEFVLLAEGLSRGHRRFAHGVFAAWYPIKRLTSARSFIADMRGSSIRDILAIELYLREATDPGCLNGCGMLVINPPFGFDDQARLLADAVLQGVGEGEVGAGTRLVRVADE